MDAGFVMKKKVNYLSLVGIMFSSSILLNLILSFVIFPFNDAMNKYIVFLSVNTVVHILSILIPSIIVCIIIRPSKQDLKLTRTSWKNVFLSIFIGFCAIPIINTANYIALILIKTVTGHINLPAIPEASSMVEVAIGLVLIALYPALSEEFFFRGVMQNAFESRYHIKSTVLFTAFIFGINHFSIQVFVGIFLLGVLFSLVSYRTKSLIPVIIIHFVNNAVSTILSYFQKSSNEVPTVNDLYEMAIHKSQEFYSGLLTYILLISICTFLLIILYRCLSIKSSSDNSLKTKSPGTIWFVPGIIIIFIIFATEIFMLFNV